MTGVPGALFVRDRAGGGFKLCSGQSCIVKYK